MARLVTNNGIFIRENGSQLIPTAGTAFTSLTSNEKNAINFFPLQIHIDQVIVVLHMGHLSAPTNFGAGFGQSSTDWSDSHSFFLSTKLDIVSKTLAVRLPSLLNFRARCRWLKSVHVSTLMDYCTDTSIELLDQEVQESKVTQSLLRTSCYELTLLIMRPIHIDPQAASHSVNNATLQPWRFLTISLQSATHSFPSRLSIRVKRLAVFAIRYDTSKNALCCPTQRR